MQILAETFAAPKAGSAESEYEDAAWPNRPTRRNIDDRFRCAVADGATETSYSRTWAHMLVGAFASNNLRGPDQSELAVMRASWRRAVDTRLSKSVAWYAAAKARSGAFAALVALELKGERDATIGRWSSFAIGDSCLVQMRGDEVLAAFPLVDSESFNDRPRLLGSVPVGGDDVVTFARTDGEWRRDDRFFLLSDAIACWFHKSRESGHSPWKILSELKSKDQPSFRGWLDDLRAAKELKNDDVTILRLQLSADAG